MRLYIIFISVIILFSYSFITGYAEVVFIKHIIENDYGMPRNVCGIDIDKDGDGDFLISDSESSEVILFINDGNNIFVKHIIEEEINNSKPYAIDVNRDGDIDIYSTGDQNNLYNIFYWENEGNNSFTKHKIGGVALDDLDYVTALDMDKDTDIDFVSHASFFEPITLWLNNGSQSFNKKEVYSYDIGRYSQAIDIDLDGDGDILSIGKDYSSENYSLDWLENNGSNNFTKHKIIDYLSASPDMPFPTDLDRDGDIDIIDTDDASYSLRWWENNGEQYFQEHTITDSFSDEPIQVIDIDKDGDKDIICYGNYGLHLWENDGNQKFSDHVIDNSFWQLFDFSIVDIDGDGDCDILSVGLGNDRIIWLENSGNPTPPTYLLYIPEIVLVNNTPPYDANKIEITAKVLNQGEDAVNNVEVSFYKASFTSGTLGNSTITSSIEPGNHDWTPILTKNVSDIWATNGESKTIYAKVTKVNGSSVDNGAQGHQKYAVGVARINGQPFKWQEDDYYFKNSGGFEIAYIKSYLNAILGEGYLTALNLLKVINFFSNSGHCYGMASTCSIYKMDPGKKPPPQKKTYDMREEDVGVIDRIRKYQCSQIEEFYTIVDTELWEPYQNLKAMIDNCGNRLPNMNFKGSYGLLARGGHTVTPYKYIEKQDDSGALVDARVYIYDNNMPYWKFDRNAPTCAHFRFFREPPDIICPIYYLSDGNYDWDHAMTHNYMHPSNPFTTVWWSLGSSNVKSNSDLENARAVLLDAINREAGALIDEGVIRLMFETSSAEPLITDQYNRRVGILDGQTINEIPGASIEELYDGKLIIIEVPDSLTYTITVNGTSAGTLTQYIAMPKNGSSVETVCHEGISTIFGSEATTDVNISSDFEMSIDNDGDGTIDEVEYPSSQGTVWPNPIDNIGIFRPSSGLWAVRGITRCYFGSNQDIPLPHDFDGDGETDIAIYRGNSGLWAIKGVSRAYFGGNQDSPVPEDYDGDGSTDIGIWRGSSGLWAIRNVSRCYFGSASDIPVNADYNGDGLCETAIFRPSSGLWAIRSLSRCYFGGGNDVPKPSDYDGDGSCDIAIFRSSSGLWAVRGITRCYFGRYNDQPIPCDIDGDGKDNIGIFRPSTGLWAIRGCTRCYFGGFGDVPVLFPIGKIAVTYTPVPTPPIPIKTPTPYIPVRTPTPYIPVKTPTPSIPVNTPTPSIPPATPSPSPTLPLRTPSPSPTVNIPSGVIAYWPFNSNANDASGNGHHGTGYNVTYSSGKFDLAVSFTGSNSYVNVGGDIVGKDQSVSACLWFKSSSDTNPPDIQMLYGISKTGGAEWRLYFQTSGKLVAEVRGNNGNPTLSSGETTEDYYDGNWHFAAVIWEKTSSTIILYVDGALKKENSASLNGTFTTSDPLNFGCHSNNGSSGAGYFFTGLIDQTRVFNRALSNAEVTSLYSE